MLTAGRASPGAIYTSTPASAGDMSPPGQVGQAESPPHLVSASVQLHSRATGPPDFREDQAPPLADAPISRLNFVIRHFCRPSDLVGSNVSERRAE